MWLEQISLKSYDGYMAMVDLPSRNGGFVWNMYNPMDPRIRC